jgi:PAS domain S-box-containing protein
VEKATPLRELPDRLLRVLHAAPEKPAPDSPVGVELGEAGEAPKPVGLGEAGEAPKPVGEDLADDSATVLAQHLERFRTVFDQGAIGMATMTLTGTVVRVNAALAGLTGADEAALIGRHYFDLTGTAPDEALREALTRVAGGGADVAEVEHALPVGGSTIRVRSTVTVVRDPDGRPLYLFAQAENVTSQRRIMDELRASEERFRLLVEGVIDYAIFMLDPGGHVTTWNAGAERMKGYRAEEILGRHFRVFYPEEARELRHPEYELEVAVRDGRYEEEGWRVRKDGTHFWANVVISALFDQDRTLVGFAKVTRDVTERRRAEKSRERAAGELASAIGRLQAANEQTSDFLAIVAHELRSPIAAMTGAADLLSGHWADLGEDQRAENFQNLARSAGRTRRLLDELLMASRLEAGQLEVAVEPVALAPIIAEAAAGAPAPVEVLGGGDVMVAADRLRVVQILTNLLGNAARYGDPPFTVEVRTTGDAAEIRVCDAGPGIDPALEPQLFRKFVRGRGRRDRGTGLGLFIVRELSRRQGGEAWYERDADGRSCFCFTLPRPA